MRQDGGGEMKASVALSGRDGCPSGLADRPLTVPRRSSRSWQKVTTEVYAHLTGSDLPFRLTARHLAAFREVKLTLPSCAT